MQDSAELALAVASSRGRAENDPQPRLEADVVASLSGFGVARTQASCGADHEASDTTRSSLDSMLNAPYSGARMPRTLAPAGAPLRIRSLLFALLSGASCAGSGAPAETPEKTLSVAWPVDNEHSIGGYPLTEVGDPIAQQSNVGKAMCFGGEQDALVFPVNPLDAQVAFTIEALVQPEAGGGPKQQFLHLEDREQESRVLLETRLAAGGGWYLHSFVRGADEELELETPSARHAADEWHWVALTYADGQVRQYVDGKLDSSGSAALPPMKAGSMSLGARLSLEGYFKGCVRELRFATAALRPADLARRIPASGDAR